MTHRSDRDVNSGFVVDPNEFQRFDQVYDVFNRSWWDDSVRTDKTEKFYETYREPLTEWRRARGFRRHDYAIRNAAWHVADHFAELHEDDDRRDGFLDPLSALREASATKEDVGTPAEATIDIKKVARVFGADLVGVAPYDERWQYTHRYSRQYESQKPNEIGKGLDFVIVVGQAMDPSWIETAPSALAGAATGLGYSQDAIVLLGLAQFIRNLGYRAVPSMNDTGLAIPYAIEAGLGEYGRHGLVITPEFGPNVRFGKIYTDLPLVLDHPQKFGVQEMCQKCRLCTDACPASAIPGGKPSTERHNVSNIAGVTKWSVDGEACFSYWAKINSDCSVCIRVCPYTRDYSKRTNRLWASLARSRFKKLALALHKRSGVGKRVSPAEWWASTPGQPISLDSPTAETPDPG